MQVRCKAYLSLLLSLILPSIPGSVACSFGQPGMLGQSVQAQRLGGDSASCSSPSTRLRHQTGGM